MKNKKALVWSEISWWVIGLIILALVIIGLFLLSKQGLNLIDKIKDLKFWG